MPAATLEQIFHHTSINRIVSSLRGGSYRMCKYYGMMPGGPNVNNMPGEVFGWDLFDNTRKIPTGRLRDAGPASASRQTVGHVTATCYRQFEQIPVSVDKIFRNRGIGQSLGTVDVKGERYLAKQIAFQAEKFANAREILLAWMFRGGFEMATNGDDVHPVPTGSGASISVDYKHPASNQGTCDGTFAGNWQVTGTANPINELIALNAHAAKNSRYAMKTAWCTAQTAQYLMNNDKVKEMGGTANVWMGDPRDQNRGTLDYDGSLNMDGDLSNVHSFVLKGFPEMKWIIYDDEIVLHDGSRSPFVADNRVIFTPDPSSDWLEWTNGSEMVQKRLGGPLEEVSGMDFYSDIERHPPRINLYGLDNGLPTPYVPAAWYYATVSA